MTSWLLLGATEGGLFDLDATLPLMAVQVVLLTFILNALFFSPVGRVVEEREGYVTTSRSEAKQKLAQAERLEADLKDQLKDARQAAQKLIQEAEQDSDKLYPMPWLRQRPMPMPPEKRPAARSMLSVSRPWASSKLTPTSSVT